MSAHTVTAPEASARLLRESGYSDDMIEQMFGYGIRAGQPPAQSKHNMSHEDYIADLERAHPDYWGTADVEEME